ncbi:peptidoglycan-binding domain-containing protein [Singulisphaera sp. PoT]|uniref:peptidoglycan-binding domain-containing protein n=1 Tax=Singulisphaera sp. PoT TaxID=3411797 RepID=UPI003BF4E14F
MVLGLACLSVVWAKAAEPKLSGPEWVKQFPGSRKMEDLNDEFRPKFQLFQAALKEAGATTRINSTLRPPERAYLMHWCWRIARQDFDPREVPAREGVDIRWWHGDAATSKQKALEMVNAYGMKNLQVRPALNSRHTEGKAVDMDVTWKDTLKIERHDGTTVEISSAPRDSTNPDLIEVAKGYGVIHFINVPKDAVHWSTDGR